MNSVFKAVPKNVRILVYADDIVLISASKQLPTVRRQLSTAVHAINQWAKQIKFRLSASKSCLLHVCTRKRHRWANAKTVIEIDGAAIPEVKTARILGVWINRKGLFTAHGAKTKEALRNRISFISALAPKANRSSLWKICNAVCLSKLMYGVELFGTDLANTLQPTFNQLLRITSGALRSSPTLSLAVEAGSFHLIYVLLKSISANIAV